MYITGPAVGQAQTPSQTRSSNSSGSGLDSGSLDSTFAQLLVAQLQSQDPLNPMDPTQFVTQLVGLNTLDAVTNIYQLLQSFTGQTSATSPNHPGTGGN